jgi:hypothetical protein
VKKNINFDQNSKSKKIITIDPSGTGTTGIYFFDQETNNEIFQEYQNSK